MAITSRCLCEFRQGTTHQTAGIMGAVSVLVRTIQFEVIDASQLPKCGLVAGAFDPSVGDFDTLLGYWCSHWPSDRRHTAEPADTMPFLFNGQLWRTFPYLLSAIGTAVLPAGCAVACWFWLPEAGEVPL
jgi:hypothetical protein